MITPTFTHRSYEYTREDSTLIHAFILDAHEVGTNRVVPSDLSILLLQDDDDDDPTGVIVPATDIPTLWQYLNQPRVTAALGIPAAPMTYAPLEKTALDTIETLDQYTLTATRIEPAYTWQNIYFPAKTFTLSCSLTLDTLQLFTCHEEGEFAGDEGDITLTLEEARVLYQFLASTQEHITQQLLVAA